MAYSEKSAARLAALHGEIEARKEHEFAAPTYRDAAALAEIRQTVFNQLESEHEHDRDTVEDSIAVLRYLAENYENMGRTACALPLRKKVLELDAEFAARFGNSEAFVDENTEEASAVREGIESDYYCALKARNRYGRDECADLREIAAGLLPLDKFKSKKMFLKTIRCLCATELNYRKSILRLSMRLSGCSKKNAEKMRIRLRQRRQKRGF